MNDCENILKTKLQMGNGKIARENKLQLKEKRVKRIMEALSFESGTQENPKKHLIGILPNDIEVFYLKPGKESKPGKKPNLYDMRPVVNNDNLKLSFDQIFDIILKVSLINKNEFNKLLILIYRLAYMFDFQENAGKVRYMPNEKILNCIKNLETSCNNCFEPYGLLGFLNFLDLLGWNEDNKYHIVDGKPDFEKPFNVGRMNTLLSCIAIPSLASDFVEHVLDKKDNPKEINHKIILEITQRLIKSRGICAPSKSQLLKWLNPYLYI
jgi:hypothetical protein